MASYNVFRRLAKNSEKVIVDESLFGDNKFALPEHVLWLAVIERAMMDYIGRTASLPKANKRSINEFFFEDVPRPNNLIYICENLFDFPDAVPMIRKRIIELAKLWQDKPPQRNANNYYALTLTRRRVDSR